MAIIPTHIKVCSSEKKQLVNHIVELFNLIYWRCLLMLYEVVSYLCSCLWSINILLHPVSDPNTLVESSRQDNALAGCSCINMRAFTRAKSLVFSRPDVWSMEQKIFSTKSISHTCITSYWDIVVVFYNISIIILCVAMRKMISYLCIFCHIIQLYVEILK